MKRLGESESVDVLQISYLETLKDYKVSSTMRSAKFCDQRCGEMRKTKTLQAWIIKMQKNDNEILVS